MDPFLGLLVCSFRCLLTSMSSLSKWRKRKIAIYHPKSVRLRSPRLLELQLYSDLSLSVKRFVLVFYFLLLHKWRSPPHGLPLGNIISNIVVRNSNRALDVEEEKGGCLSTLPLFSLPIVPRDLSFSLLTARKGLCWGESHKWLTCF